jgi:hypothetical protein
VSELGAAGQRLRVSSRFDNVALDGPASILQLSARMFLFCSIRKPGVKVCTPFHPRRPTASFTMIKSIEPRGLSREGGAAYLGIGTTLFGIVLSEQGGCQSPRIWTVGSFGTDVALTE